MNYIKSRTGKRRASLLYHKKKKPKYNVTKGLGKEIATLNLLKAIPSATVATAGVTTQHLLLDSIEEPKREVLTFSAITNTTGTVKTYYIHPIQAWNPIKVGDA